jgi:hypothetical protein
MSQTLTQALSVLLGVIASLGITALLIYIFVASSGQGRWSGSQAERTAYYLDRVADESLDRARQHWQRAGRTIRFGPVKAFYCGDQPDNLNRFTPDAGALAIVDARLVFRSASSANFEIDLPLESIHWFGQPNVTVQQVNALTFYVEHDSRWRLYTIGVDHVPHVAQALQEIGGVELNPLSDYGPVNTLRYDENIYGHWVPDHTVRLYLIPDHLLADWRTIVRFDQIQGVVVLPSGGLSPAASALLSIRYTSDDGKPRGIGFALGWDKARAWAAMLEERTGVEPDQVERKKKIG